MRRGLEVTVWATLVVTLLIVATAAVFLWDEARLRGQQRGETMRATERAAAQSKALAECGAILGLGQDPPPPLPPRRLQGVRGGRPIFLVQQHEGPAANDTHGTARVDIRVSLHAIFPDGFSLLPVDEGRPGRGTPVPGCESWLRVDGDQQDLALDLVRHRGVVPALKLLNGGRVALHHRTLSVVHHGLSPADLAEAARRAADAAAVLDDAGDGVMAAFARQYQLVLGPFGACQHRPARGVVRGVPVRITVEAAGRREPITVLRARIRRPVSAGLFMGTARPGAIRRCLTGNAVLDGSIVVSCDDPPALRAKLGPGATGTVLAVLTGYADAVVREGEIVVRVPDRPNPKLLGLVDELVDLSHLLSAGDPGWTATLQTAIEEVSDRIEPVQELARVRSHSR